MAQHPLKLKSFDSEKLPEVLKPFPHLAAEILGEHMLVDFIDGCTLDRDDEPFDFLVVSPEGLLHGDVEEGYGADAEEYLEVTFVPWAEIEAIRVSEATVRFQLKNNSRPGPSVDAFVAGEEATEEQARAFFAQAVRFRLGRKPSGPSFA